MSNPKLRGRFALFLLFIFFGLSLAAHSTAGKSSSDADSPTKNAGAASVNIWSLAFDHSVNDILGEEDTVALSAISATAPTSCAGVDSLARHDFNVGSDPASIAVGDFNGWQC